MKLEELIQKRFTEREGLTKFLVKFGDYPAIFSPEAPKDNQNWGTDVHYPRLVYNYDMQADEERKSAGTLSVSLLCQNTEDATEEDITPEMLEPLVRDCLKDVLLHSEDGKLYAFAWNRTDAFELAESKTDLIIGSDVRFDILEYTSQETTDPDPVMAMNKFVKELYPECIVVGLDRMEEITEASRETPVIYCRLNSMEKVEETNALKSNTDSSVNSAFGAGVSTTMPVSVTLDYSLVNPTKTFTIGGGGSGSTTLTVSAHASGGYVNDKQLSWVGEEGPEAIIPLVPGRRNRALELYKEVGDILGVQANANGNIIGEAAPLGGGSGSTTIGSTATEMFAYSSISDFLSLNDNLLAEAIRNGATGYNGFTEGTESDSDTADEPLSSSSTVETGKTNINLNIQMSPQFNISDSGTGKMDEASIMAIIRKNMKSMADELGGEIADRLEQVFSNMPVVKEG